MDDSSFTNDKYLHLYIRGKGTMGNGTLGNGTFQMFQGRRDISIIWETGHSIFSEKRDTLFSGKRDILSSGNDFILWQSGHLSSGNRTTYPLGIGTWETGHAILWESGHLSSGKHPLGIGNLGDEV